MDWNKCDAVSRYPSALVSPIWGETLHLLISAKKALHVDVQSLIPPTIANHDFILYGGTAAKRYAEENDMIYGGTDPSVTVTKTTTIAGTTTATTTAVSVNMPANTESGVTTTAPSASTEPAVTTITIERGDANGDGRINVLDASHIARFIAQGKVKQLGDEADFNKDGKVNVADAAAIARYIASGKKA